MSFKKAPKGPTLLNYERSKILRDLYAQTMINFLVDESNVNYVIDETALV